MEFCDKCGSRMTRTKEGFLCPKCGVVVPAKFETPLGKQKKRDGSGYIYVSGPSEGSYSKVSRQCPRCGNKKAFRSSSGILGEHAGIGRERTLEHFRCTKCSYYWTEQS
ncbi:MAG TPA: hypothetical protein VEC97_05315 [Candidatus Acidoferrales bacterium]|nr:hypothetical protein [Candidatus Acidoferrales bacterium]